MEHQFDQNILSSPDPQTEFYYNNKSKSSGFNILMKWALMGESEKAHQEMIRVLNSICKYFPNIVNSRNSSGLTVLMIAAMNSTTFSNNKIVKTVIDAGANVNIQDNEEKTALIHVIQNFDKHNINHQMVTIRLLLNGGADVNIQDNKKSTALTYAVSTNCCPQLIQILIDSGATSDNPTTDGLTPLMYCILSNYCYDDHILRIMIKASSNINTRNKDGTTVLMYVIQNINNNYLPGIVSQLIDADADVNTQTDEGMTPLLHLINTCSQDEDMIKLFEPVLQLLLKGGLYIDLPNADDQTSLIYASIKNGPHISEIIRSLIFYGADIYSIDDNGMSALFYLVSMNHEIAPDIIQTLGMIGGNLDIINGMDTNLLTYACLHCPHDSIEKVVDALIKAGADVNATNKNGRTSLMETSMNSKEKSTNDVVKLLIKGGAELNARDKTGLTAIALAVQCTNTTSSNDTINTLIEAKADINISTDQDNSPIIFATYHAGGESSNQTLKILVDAGVDINAKNDQGYDALYYAVDKYGACCNEETIQILLDGGANVNTSGGRNFLSTVIEKYIDNQNFPINIVKIAISKFFSDRTKDELNVILELILTNQNYFQSSFNDDDKCTICLEGSIDHDHVVQLLFCSHRFHRKCIDKWLKEDEVCPLCRTKIKF